MLNPDFRDILSCLKNETVDAAYDLSGTKPCKSSFLAGIIQRSPCYKFTTNKRLALIEETLKVFTRFPGSMFFSFTSTPRLVRAFERRERPEFVFDAC